MAESYSSRFNVDNWLEASAQWLAWSFDALTAGNMVDARYNLDQFWKSLEPWKSVGLRAKEWGDLMTLDAQANWVLGNWYDHAASALLQAAASMDQVEGVVQFVIPTLGITQWLMDKAGVNLERLSLEQALAYLQDQRSKAYATAQELAQQAKAALDAAGAPPGQAGNTVAVTSNAVASSPSRSDFERRIANTTFKPLYDQLPDAIKAPWGIPWYWWALGIAAVALLPVLASPRVTIRRD